MSDHLPSHFFLQLIQTVSSPQPIYRNFPIFLGVSEHQLPDARDQQQWQSPIGEWNQVGGKNPRQLDSERGSLRFYSNMHRKDSDPREICYEAPVFRRSFLASKLEKQGRGVPFLNRLNPQRLILPPTQFSARAPLKVPTRKYDLEATPSAGFSRRDPYVPSGQVEINPRVEAAIYPRNRDETAEIEFLGPQYLYDNCDSTRRWYFRKVQE